MKVWRLIRYSLWFSIAKVFGGIATGADAAATFAMRLASKSAPPPPLP